MKHTKKCQLPPVKVTDTMREAIIKAAELEERSVTEWIREAIRNALKEIENDELIEKHLNIK